MGHNHWDGCCKDPSCVEEAERGSSYCNAHRGKAKKTASAETKKDTNPKDAIGSEKVPLFSVMPRRVLADVALALLEGAAKYGRHNYRAAGVRASVYVDATDRHLSAWWEGQDIDPDSGLSHVTKAIASLTVLRDSMLQGNWVDDRPPRVSDHETWVTELNAKAKTMIAKFPNPVKPLTQLLNLVLK